MAAETRPRETLVAIAQCGRAVGLGGFCRVVLLTDSVARLKRTKAFFVGNREADAAPTRVAEVREQGNGILVRFEGVTDRTAAAKYSGSYLFARETAKAKSGGEAGVRIDELKGCEVFDESGRRWGTIRDVYSLPANDVWSIWTGTREVLVPAVKAWIRRVDLEKRVVTIAAIDGLFEV